MQLRKKYILYLSLLSAGFAKSTAKKQLRVLFTPLLENPAILSFTPEVPKKCSPVLPSIVPSIQSRYRMFLLSSFDRSVSIISNA